MPRIPAARNTLAVLRYLAAHSGPVRASTLARDLDMPRSSVYQLVRVMMEEGVLLQGSLQQCKDAAFCMGKRRFLLHGLSSPSTRYVLSKTYCSLP